MRTTGSVMRVGAGWLGVSGLCAVVGSGLLGLGVSSVAGPQSAKPDPVALGREIFHREWLPGDGRSHGGDGLGPVYNDTSCVACHNAGATGGAGPSSKNVDILSAFVNRVEVQQGAPRRGPGFLRRALGALVGVDVSPPAAPAA